MWQIWLESDVVICLLLPKIVFALYLRLLGCSMLSLQNLQYKMISARISIRKNQISFYRLPNLETVRSENVFSEA